MNNALKIAFINVYAQVNNVTNLGRHLRLADNLSPLNVAVKIIACEKHHLSKGKPSLPRKKTLHNKNVILLSGLCSRNSLLYRTLNIWTFFFQCLLIPRKKINDIDIFVGSSPDPVAALAAYCLSRRFNKPFVIEIRDVWPETLVKIHGFSNWNPYIILLGAVERFLYRKSHLITSTLPNFDKHIRSIGVNKPVFHFPNFATETFEVLEKTETTRSEKMNFIYAGSLGIANDIETLLETCRILEETGFKDKLHIDVFAANQGQIELMKKFNTLNIITIHGVKPRMKILTTMTKYDCGIALCKNSDLYRHGISANKITDYLAAGIPIILSSPVDHDLSKFDAGWVVPAENPELLAGVMRKACTLKASQLNKMRQNALELCAQRYSFESFSESFVRTFRDLKEHHASQIPTNPRR